MGSDLGHEQFSRLADFIEHNYGIKIPPEKKVMIQARLSKRVRSLNLASMDEYIQFLLDDPMAADEVSRMTDLVSTHMTSFWREPSHFDLLAQNLVPDLCSRHNFSRQDPLVVWSAACSTGEEVYTLAMVLEQFRISHHAEYPNFEYAVVGTDLSSGVLETARMAIYPAAAAESVPQPYRGKYLMWSRAVKHPVVRVVPELRQRTFFHPLNLMEFPYEFGNAVHIVFCRNVLIYFNHDRQENVLRNLCRILVPNGFIVVGHAESILKMELGLTHFAPTAYRKVNKQDSGNE